MHGVESETNIIQIACNAVMKLLLTARHLFVLTKVLGRCVDSGNRISKRSQIEGTRN